MTVESTGLPSCFMDEDQNLTFHQLSKISLDGVGVREARGTCPRYQLNMHNLGYKKPFITATVSRFRIETTHATFAETSKGRQSIVHESYNYQKIRQNCEQSLCTPIKENFD